MNFLYLLSGWFCGMGIGLLLRWNALHKGFMKSDFDRFLDYFEKDYLMAENPTKRHKYSYVYNSYLYKIINVTLGVLSCIVGVVALGVVIYVDYWS